MDIYVIIPLTAGGLPQRGVMPRTFTAPTLLLAFSAARSVWPTASGWKWVA